MVNSIQSFKGMDLCSTIFEVVLHHLTEAMMEGWVELCKKLLLTVGRAKHRGGTHFLTVDESWCWPTIDCQQQWLPSGAERETHQAEKKINSPKAMIIVFWSPVGFPVIWALTPKMTFTVEFFVDDISPDVVAAKPSSNPKRRLALHVDNDSPHRRY
jgi:hypothetical protein